MTAAAIIDYRTQNGPFATVDDLIDVTGIGPSTLEQIRPVRHGMNAWALPAAAAAFWAGLLAWEVRPPWARPWMGIVVGLAGLAGAWLAAPRTAGSIRSARERRDSPSPGARPWRSSQRTARRRGVAGSPRSRSRSIGLVLLGAGWSGVHASWLDGLAARPARRRSASTVVGTLHTDPEAGAFGWHATLDVTRVEWPRRGRVRCAPRCG